MVSRFIGAAARILGATAAVGAAHGSEESEVGSGRYGSRRRLGLTNELSDPPDAQTPGRLIRSATFEGDLPLVRDERHRD